MRQLKISINHYLIKVYRIGEVTLEKIKEQGLACVDVDEEKDEEEKENVEQDKNENNEEMKYHELVDEVVVEEDKELLKNESVYEESSEKKNTELGVIKLDAKTIKTEDNKLIKSKFISLKIKIFLIYLISIISFCIICIFELLDFLIEITK